MYPYVLFWVCSIFVVQSHTLLLCHTQGTCQKELCFKDQKNSCFFIRGSPLFRFVYFNSNLISFCWFVGTNLYNVPRIHIQRFQEQLCSTFLVVELFSIKSRRHVGWSTFRSKHCWSLSSHHFFHDLALTLSSVLNPVKLWCQLKWYKY